MKILNNRETLLNNIIKDNMQFSNMRQQLDLMEEFKVDSADGVRQDVFNYLPAKGSTAVGYRVIRKSGHLIAEPWVWRVTNERQLVGAEITERVKGAMYFGVVVKQAFIQQYGTKAYSLILGNMRLLEQNKLRLKSY